MRGFTRYSIGSIVLVAFLAFSATAMADLQAGIDAYQNKDYQAALTEFTTLAEEGNAEAQHILGIIYAEGEAVPQDYKVAISWYRKAAEQGHPNAQVSVGAMSARGLGVPTDYQAAMSWYLKAAEQGNPVAQNSIGFMYLNGQGVPADLVQAYMWFSLAAAAGNEDAKLNKAEAEALMTPDEIENAEKLTRDWSAKHK